jgi:hypothetical protein
MNLNGWWNRHEGGHPLGFKQGCFRVSEATRPNDRNVARFSRPSHCCQNPLGNLFLQLLRGRKPKVRFWSRNAVSLRSAAAPKRSVKRQTEYLGGPLCTGHCTKAQSTSMPHAHGGGYVKHAECTGQEAPGLHN